MIGKTVVHVSFGEGVIVNWNDNTFSVNFGDLGTKHFDPKQSMKYFPEALLKAYEEINRTRDEITRIEELLLSNKIALEQYLLKIREFSEQIKLLCTGGMSQFSDMQKRSSYLPSKLLRTTADNNSPEYILATSKLWNSIREETESLEEESKINTFIHMSSRQRLDNCRIIDTAEMKLKTLSQASKDGFLRDEINTLGEQLLNAEISGEEYLKRLEELFYPILVGAPPDKTHILEFLRMYKKNYTTSLTGPVPDANEEEKYKRYIVWEPVLEIHDRIVKSAKTELFLRMSPRQWTDNWIILDTVKMKLKVLFRAALNGTLKEESFQLPENETETVKLLGQLIACNDSQQRVRLFTKFHDALQTEIVDRSWDLSQNLNYNDLIPVCTRGITEYCEGKPWPAKNISDPFDRAAFCPRMRKPCMESDGARIWPQNDLETEKWTLLELFSHEHITPVVSGLSNPEEYVPRMAGWINRINEIRERIRCSNCDSVMISNKKYSKNFAAYNATVFDCANGEGHDHNVYLSHCWACRTIIDSRQNRIKDHDGYYLCLQCGSGSRQSQNNPGNICPQCGSSPMKQDTKWNRVFHCTRCSHTITVPAQL